MWAFGRDKPIKIVAKLRGKPGAQPGASGMAVWLLHKPYYLVLLKYHVITQAQSNNSETQLITSEKTEAY